MSKLKFIFIIIGFFIASSKIVGQSEKELRQKIDFLNQKFITSIIEDDVDSFVSTYTDDAVVMLPFQAPLKGKHALITHFHNNMATGAKIESADVIILDIWASGQFIYERGSYQITYKRRPNNIKAINGSYFSVWKKQPDGSYKIKFDIANLDHGV